MTALAESPVTQSQTIESLTETVNREHALVLQAAQGMLQHAIVAGEALAALKAQIPKGTWKAWANANLDVSWGTVKRYQRVAHFKDRLNDLGATSIEEALTILKGAERDDVKHGSYRVSHTIRAEALRLHRRGVSQRDICELLGASPTAVYWWTHPAKHRAHLKKLRARDVETRQLREQRRARAISRAVRKNGAALAELYSMAERMQDVLGQAEREEATEDARRSLALAGQHYRRMRDEIVKALGTHA